MQYIFIVIVIGLVGWGAYNFSSEEADSNPEQPKTVEESKNDEAAAQIERLAQFTSDYSSNSEVVTTSSGLQYIVLKEGDGATSPTVANTVEVHYHGTTVDGSVFDSSVLRGEPIKFPLSNLIAGWQEGIPLMSNGAKYRFVIPAELAYGPAGSGHSLSGQTLTFDVELISFQ